MSQKVKLFFEPNSGTITTSQYIGIFTSIKGSIQKISFKISIDTDSSEINDIIINPDIAKTTKVTRTDKNIFIETTLPNQADLQNFKIVTLSVRPTKYGTLKLELPRDSIVVKTQDNSFVSISASKASFKIQGTQVFHETVTQQPSRTPTTTIAFVHTPTPITTMSNKPTKNYGSILVINVILILLIVGLALVAKTLMRKPQNTKTNLSQTKSNDPKEDQSKSNP